VRQKFYICVWIKIEPRIEINH